MAAVESENSNLGGETFSRKNMGFANEKIPGFPRQMFRTFRLEYECNSTFCLLFRITEVFFS